MRRFRFIVGATTVLSQIFVVVAASWVAAHFFDAQVAWLFGVVLGVSGAALFPGRVALLIRDRPIGSSRRLVERAYYVHWGASVLAVPLSLVVVPLALVASHLGVFAGVALTYALSLLVALYSVFVRPVWVRVRQVDVAIPGLASGFDGYRIAHLSDLHVGSLCPASRADRWVRLTNALDVDAVALTGDYVTSGTLFHEVTARSLSALKAKDGVFAVLGNHDDYGRGEPLRTALKDGGIRLLENERVVISRGEAHLTIAGVGDNFAKNADVERTFSGIDRDATVVALVHNPSLFPKLVAHHVGLQLSGHTHWGQVGLPFFEERINFAARYYRLHSGFVRDGASTLYIHPGLGMTGPPLRLGVAPEITVLRLRSAPATTR